MISLDAEFFDRCVANAATPMALNAITLTCDNSLVPECADVVFSPTLIERS
jgi:hypothetical protein